MENWSPLYLFGVALIFMTSNSLGDQPNQVLQPINEQVETYRMSFDKLLKFAGEENVHLQRIKDASSKVISHANGDALVIERCECARDLGLIAIMQGMAIAELLELDPKAFSLQNDIAKPGNAGRQDARILALRSHLKLLDVIGGQAQMRFKKWQLKNAGKNQGPDIPGIKAIDTDPKLI